MKSSTVLITGASRGIGQAAASAFAARGYRLVLNCFHSKEKLETFAEELRRDYGVSVLTCCGDIGDYNFVCGLFNQMKQFAPGIDILVNNAGIDYIGLLSDMTLKEWNHVINTNLTSVFSCCKMAIPYMVSQKQGKIINISSAWGSVGASCEAAYSAAKGGMNALTKALAKELAPSNIQVNAIACGVIDTDMNRCFSREERAALNEEIPAGRFGSPKEAAHLILQLAESPSYLTGQIIGLDGGWI
ncbi:MAG: 3-oxoacyl-ACP reductase FabG [Lachnospiraceae bacterium]|uniref:elongation factor P 5-aminopentanone reductase n=1 Tax=Roseburia sp. 1XD42-69 TaxID=2320088 RepID=UPI000EA3B382|nr:3-oxoacyl-ACP reductase FabG [Roseburia sp. 1XD42-69]MCI8875301.1 3-oxoacyl-ACP reductase FabG [Lachnospiraceae bacterium]RKJ66108.1 SDR family NAD(P)-dependent oxidoreductase [Roseburia sp. 1XD42-69]